jgi:multidrug efflux pump subunit AcrA (membrane-fusion protein)
MNVVRTWVFPILRILIIAAVAVALVKIAFFPDVAEDPNPAVPGAEIIEPQVAVTVGTIQNDVSLSGTINADAAVPITATLTGEVTQTFVRVGTKVKKDQRILVLTADTVNANGTPIKQQRVVKAPRAGTVSSFTALKGQVFSVGDPMGQIAPPTFTASGSILPEQLYRLLEEPTEAQVTINGGPAPFTCKGVKISAPLAGAGDGEGGEGAGGPTVSCAIPGDVKVFAGLTAEIVIAGGIAENVLVVPMTSVEGVAETGNVYIVLEDGTTELREVTLGMNDGVSVEVKTGLVEGEMILQFVPGAEGDGTDGGIDPGFGGECFVDENGMEICEDVVR